MPITPQSITVEFDVPATMRDGMILRANVYRPAGEGRWPILLTRLPYGKDFANLHFPAPVQAARRGYVVVVQDTRGRFASEGEFVPFDCEAEDGFDTIAWAASLPYADGQVGLIGASYVGFTQWAAATLRPPALRAMAPAFTWADAADGLIYRGGAFELGLAANWHLMLGLDVLARRHRTEPETLGRAVKALCAEVDVLAGEGYSSLPLAQFAPLVRQDVAPDFLQEFLTPMDRKRLAPRTIAGKHAQVQVPTLHIGGWYDVFLGGTLAHYKAMRALGRPSKLIVGPWTHLGQQNPIGELSFGFGAQAGFVDLQMDLGSLQLRWFDHWLKGTDTGMMDEPPIKLFVMGTNVWREEQEWPPVRTQYTKFYLHEQAGLSQDLPGDEVPDRYDYDPSDPVPTRGGATLLTPEYPAGPFDQRPVEARPDVLVYRTAPLEQDLEVTGPISVRLWAVSSAPDTDFVARLIDIYPDGRAISLADGIIRARHRRQALGEPPSLVEPGRAYEYAIDLWATSNVFKAGHRIGLQITSSNFPRWDRNPNTGHDFGQDAELQVAHQTILHDRDHPSHVVLPVIPAA